MQIPKAPIATGSFGLLVLGGTRATDKGHEFLDQAPGEGHESHEFLDQAPDEGHEFLDQTPEEGHGRRGRHGGGPRSSAAEGHGRRRISHKGGVIVSKTYQICVLEGLKKKAALRNNTVPQHNTGEGEGLDRIFPE